MDGKYAGSLALFTQWYAELHIEWTDQSGTVVGNGGSVQVCPTSNEVYTAKLPIPIVMDPLWSSDNQAVKICIKSYLKYGPCGHSDCGQSNGNAQLVLFLGGGAVQWQWDNGEIVLLLIFLLDFIV